MNLKKVDSIEKTEDEVQDLITQFSKLSYDERVATHMKLFKIAGSLEDQQQMMMKVVKGLDNLLSDTDPDF